MIYFCLCTYCLYHIYSHSHSYSCNYSYDYISTVLFLFSSVFGTHIMSIVFPCIFWPLFTNVFVLCKRASHLLGRRGRRGRKGRLVWSRCIEVSRGGICRCWGCHWKTCHFYLNTSKILIYLWHFLFLIWISLVSIFQSSKLRMSELYFNSVF